MKPPHLPMMMKRNGTAPTANPEDRGKSGGGHSTIFECIPNDLSIYRAFLCPASIYSGDSFFRFCSQSFQAILFPILLLIRSLMPDSALSLPKSHPQQKESGLPDEVNGFIRCQRLVYPPVFRMAALRHVLAKRVAASGDMDAVQAH